MKRFFNIIPGKDAACILLYGEIGEYDRVRSGDIARELIEAESASRQIDVRINSIGGDIFTGMAIFNAFRQSAADITIYIDGVAASMGSVIAACGKPVKMSRYARLMVHSPSGGAYGNAGEMEETAGMLKALKTLFVKFMPPDVKRQRKKSVRSGLTERTIGSLPDRRWNSDWWTKYTMPIRCRKTAPRSRYTRYSITGWRISHNTAIR